MATVLDPGQYGQNALDDFKHELKAAQRWSIIDGRRFVLASRIANWLRAPPEGSATPHASTNTRRILEALYGPNHDRPDEIDWLLRSMGRNNRDCWLRTFAILLQMEHNGQNMGKHMNAFFTQKILDARIGHLAENHVGPIFTDIGFDAGDSKRLAIQFTNLQWEFCTREAFDTVFGRIYEHGSNMIIPVTKKVLLKEGGTGMLYIVEVPRECIPFALAEEIEGPHYTRYNEDGTEGEVRQFALKVLRHRKPYDDERKAYQNLQKEDGIIRCFGNWVMRLNALENPVKMEEYYLLLEYGAYDLSEFFSLYPAPSTTEEILQFWEGLSHLLTALEKIHGCMTLATKILLLGWHCDIKPANIIYCKDGKRKGWKIGDPGFATFAEETRVRKQEGLPVVRGKGGTSAYGGPERPDGDQAPVSQRFDIWSLGCVFSEAATWVALGHRGINLFQLVRKSGQLSNDINASPGNSLETGSSTSDIDDNSLMGVQGLDRFHDGSKMSSTVKDWHTHVRQALRRCDPVTERVLEVVENNMLQADPKDRGSAFEVAEKVRSCLASARGNAEKAGFYKVPSYFKYAINQEHQQESQVIQRRMAEEGSEEWRYKYKSKAFIDATREPLLAGSQLDEHGGPFNALSHIPQSPSTRDSLQRSSTCFTRLGRMSRNTFYEPGSPNIPRENSQPSPDVLHADYMEARRQLEEAGWSLGTLEIPQTHETAVESTPSPQSPHQPRSSAHDIRALRSPQDPTPPARTKSNRRMSLIMRRFIGTSSKSKTSKSLSSSVPSPAEPGTSSVRPEPTAVQQAGGMRGRENSEHSTHRYEKFNTYFKGRDIAFLIDNAPSMAEHWIHVKDIVSVLVALLYGQDDDGIDLYFTSSKQLVGTFDEPKQFVEEMNKHRPSHGTHCKVVSPVHDPQPDFLPPDSIPRATTASTASSNELNENITEVLDGILETWSKNFMVNEKKKLTLIILTDGVWPGVSNKATLIAGIIHTLERAQNKKMLRKQLEERGLSIQFVRFGYDEAAIGALESLDNNLIGTDGQPLPDIIDHEPANGNIYKMILGSLDSKYDEDTQTSVGDGDDDLHTVTTVTEMDERREHGDIFEEPVASNSSISHGSSRRVSTTGRYKCLDAIVRGAFPNQAVATASDLIKLGQRLQIDIPDLSLDDPDSSDPLLREGSKTSEALLSSSEAQQLGHRKSVDAGLDSVRQTEGKTDGQHDETSGKKEDSSFQDEKVKLLRDTSGHEHYIGPSGSLQFLDQLRRLLISREAEVSTGHTNQITPGGSGDDVSQVLDAEILFSDGPQISNGAAPQGQNVSTLEDSLSPQANSTSSSGLEPTDEIQELMDQIPELEIVESLLHYYWNNAHDDFPLFHRESFEKEYQSFLGTSCQPVDYSPSSGVARPDHGWIGCLHMMVVFASLSSASHHNDIDSKALQKHCVDATRRLLPRIVTKCSLSGVRALLLLSLFLHNDNERNAAWNLVGTATRICFALGLHRNDTSELFSPVERETRRRVFCTLYGFEQFLASSLGRPSGVNDIDVQVVQPCEGVLNGTEEGDDALNIMFLKLNKILSTSRNPRYASASTAQAPHEAHQLSVEEVLASLKAWKTELSSQQGLDIPVIAEKDDKLPVPNGPRMELGEMKTLLGWRSLPSVRSILLLNIQYHYIYILVTRPFLLRSITASGRTGQAAPNKVGQFSDTCFRHACQMARLLLLLDSFGLIRGTSGLDVFFAYSAAMVLILRSLRLDSYHHHQQQASSAVEPPEQQAGEGGKPRQASPGQHSHEQLDEKSLLVALRELVVRLRELVLGMPKSSTMERFARAMVTFEESAYHVKVKADPSEQEGGERGEDPRSFAAQHGQQQFGPHISAPNLLFRGLMDASYGGPSPSSNGVGGLDQRMHDGGGAGMMHDQQQQQFFEYGTVLPTADMGTFGGQGNGLTAFDCLPGLNPWVMNGNSAAQHGTEMPIYGWEDLESMLGNGRSHTRKF
ncbi:hypothetical protein Daus18300_001435 [Diaporthe australafricana]|uniref:Protein kinase domain-containing protein n=1 Tax=Diaporthe australafricana TaxID=127596 RepID=A0ABR3XWQ4_9PEZI